MSSRQVLFTNNYSMPSVLERWRRGAYPGQHLYGAAHLEEAGYRVDYLPFRDVTTSRAGMALRSRVGGLSTEARAWASTPGGICYAADPFSFAGLGLLRSMRSRRHLVAATVHSKTVRSRLRDSELRAYDGVVALSKIIESELVDDIGRDPARTRWLPWGPDLRFPGYVSQGSEWVVCSGLTGRDTDTLLKALGQVDVPARVHVQRQVIPPRSVQVSLRAGYDAILYDLQRAAVIAIPLLGLPQLAGITELNDALALGKPVIMTRCPHLDVDVAAIGCGIVVEVGDVEGWVDAITRLMSDDALRAEMGRRGREFAEREWNADLFGAGIVQLMDDLSC